MECPSLLSVAVAGSDNALLSDLMERHARRQLRALKRRVDNAERMWSTRVLRRLILLKNSTTMMG
jgi:hypothetical protein